MAYQNSLLRGQKGNQTNKQQQKLKQEIRVSQFSSKAHLYYLITQ